MRLLLIATFAMFAGAAFVQAAAGAPIEMPSVYDILASEEQAIAQAHQQIAAFAHEISRLQAEIAKDKATPAPTPSPTQSPSK